MFYKNTTSPVYRRKLPPFIVICNLSLNRLFQCTFDRDCCRGLECRMSVVSHLGVGNYCQKRHSFSHTNESNSAEDEFWMVAEPWKKHEDGEDSKDKETLKYTDAISGIREIQENKGLELQRENEELERLFTEKDEDDLEKLRAIKEDMELDELRALKELRLKRKLQLLKELRELKAIKAEETLNALSSKGNKSTVSETEVVTTNSSEVINTPQEPLNGDTEQETNLNLIDDSPKTLNGTEEQNVEQPEAKINQIITTEKTNPKNRQGSRDHHHKRKHQKKHKRKTNVNSTDEENSNNLANDFHEYPVTNTSDIDIAPT